MTSSKGDHLETEQKYDADADFVLPKLGSLPDLGGRRPAKPRRIYLSATYFDTEDLALIQHKITLRRRVGGDDEGWHLKLPAGQDTRQELHEPLGSATTVPLRLANAIAPLTEGRPVSPVAELSSQRTLLRVCDPAGATVAEVADDLVTGTVFGGKTESWREIEVESGSPPALTAAGNLLLAAGARPASAKSKLGRLFST